MRKLFFVIVVAFGGLVGLVSMIEHDWFTRIGMMLVGIVVALPFASLAFCGTRKHGSRNQEDALFQGKRLRHTGTSPDELAANYWRDKGHPPFMNPSDAIPDAKVNDKH